MGKAREERGEDEELTTANHSGEERMEATRGSRRWTATFCRVRRRLANDLEREKEGKEVRWLRKHDTKLGEKLTEVAMR